MSTTTPVSTTPKVRTYAADLTAMRAERGLTAPTPRSETSTKPKPVAVTIPKKIPARIQNPPTIVASTTISREVTNPKKKPVAPISVPPVPVAPIQKTNPPFHTLNKVGVTAAPVTKIDTTDFDATTKKSKPSVLANPGVEPLTVSRTDTTDTGTIITDTKQNHVSFFGAFATTLSGWWHTKQKAAAERKQPKYTVPGAERRKGVIQKATTQTGRTSTADHAAVVNRIKAAKVTPRGTPVSRVIPPLSTAPVPEAEKTTIGWITELTPMTSQTPTPQSAEHVARVERLKNEIDELDTTLSTVAVEPITRAVITPVVPTLSPVPTPLVAEDVPPDANFESSTDVEAEAETETELETETIPVTEKEVALPITPITPFERPRIEPILQVRTANTSEPVLAETKIEITESDATVETTSQATGSAPVLASKPYWSVSLAKRTTPNTLSNLSDLRSSIWWKNTFRVTNNLVLAAGFGCGIVVVGWYGTMALLNQNNPDATPSAPTTIFTSSSVITPANMPYTKQELIDTLQAADQGGGPIVELSLLDTNTPASQTIFDLVHASVATDFITSVRHTVVGSYRTEPWVVFITTDSATAQGGMLAWEKTMSTDLAPWFGPAVQRSNKTGISLFTDSIIAGHDVRTLTNDAGTERIMYGFIAPNTLLITTNTTAFLNLSEKVQK